MVSVEPCPLIGQQPNCHLPSRTLGARAHVGVVGFHCAISAFALASGEAWENVYASHGRLPFGDLLRTASTDLKYLLDYSGDSSVCIMDWS